MREIPKSNCEKEFILKAIGERKRLDGREIYDYRRLQITFGVDRGCCEVQLGKTRVLAQVSCEITVPKQSRPTDGILFVNVELSPMAAPHFEAGKQSEQGVELNRILERCLKESRCVDTESLCIMAGLKVWTIRVDVHVINSDGNLIDCSSIAAISALAHFRRPDVTVSGEELTIHSLDDRDPIPLSVHHMPICVTFGFYVQGKLMLVDPAEAEERVMEGRMVIGMNKHREICTLQMTGSMLLLRDQVLRCSNVAVVKVTEITELIQQALQNDTLARARGEKCGFAASIEKKKLTVSQVQPEVAQRDELIRQQVEAIRMDTEMGGDSDSSGSVTILGPGTGSIGEGVRSTWETGEDEDMVEELEEEQRASHPNMEQRSDKPKHEVIELSGDSEEEGVAVLDQEQMDVPEPVSHSGSIDLSRAISSGAAAKTKKKKHKNKPKS